MEGYIIKLPVQTETPPMSLDAIRDLIQQKKIKATTLIYTEDSKKWRLASSIGEIRHLIREFDPMQDEVLNSLSSDGFSEDTIRIFAKRKEKEPKQEVAKPFWKKLWPSKKTSEDS